jgi:hypothetical protein
MQQLSPPQRPVYLHPHGKDLREMPAERVDFVEGGVCVEVHNP